jgi:uncharacterized membrane protein
MIEGGRTMSINAFIRNKVTDAFWFTPVLMGGIGMVLAQVIIEIDEWIVTQPLELPLSGMGAQGGRGILVAIAGSVLGVAATSFSITTSALATASSTYGPRLVRNFMADKRNQFVLGGFLMSFLYSLIVLRSIRDATDAGAAFVPSLAINIAILFAVVNVILLIYFIHHIADSIQISTLVSRVRDDLIRSVESLYPLEEKTDSATAGDNKDTPDRDRFAEALPDTRPSLVWAESDGYVTWIDYDAMLNRAVEHDALVKLLIQPGDYMFVGMAVAHVWQRKSDGAEQQITWPLISVNTAQTRTPYQDIRYAVQQPVDITIRALSPGTNDPYTAINALHGLSSGLTRLSQRQNAEAVLFDSHSKPRLHKKTITIEHIIDSVFRTLRSNVIQSVDATMAVLDLASDILATTERDSYRQITLRSVGQIEDTFLSSSAPEADKMIVKNATHQIISDNSLEQPATPHSPVAVEERLDD